MQSPAEPRFRFPPAFESYVAPARASNGIWRLLLGLCLVGLGYAVWSLSVINAYTWLSWPGSLQITASPVLDATKARDTLVLLATFLGMGLGTILVVRYLHHRPVRTLFGRASLVLRDFLIAAGVLGGVFSATMVLWVLRFDAVPQLDAAAWLMLLPLSLLGLLIQTGAEEVLFRGYLQQQLAARFTSRLVWLLLPSLLFGAAHYNPGVLGENVWLTVTATTIFALLVADLTAVSGSIGAAWGFHFANNFVAMLILAVKGSIPGLALYTTPYTVDQSDGMLGLVAIDIGALILSWLLVRRLIQR